MSVISVNVGRPREVVSHGHLISTGIFKEPVEGSIAVRWLNIEGDRQADLSAHGGKYKAIYAYPSEHYDYWRRELPDMNLPWAMFGENLTTAGLSEDSVMIGDQYLVGTARLQVTQPRLPCYKLGIRFGREDMEKRFLESGRTGFYFSVLQEGEVEAGAAITLLARDENSMKVSEIVRLYRDSSDVSALRRAVELQTLPDSMREYFRRRKNRSPE